MQKPKLQLITPSQALPFPPRRRCVFDFAVGALVLAFASHAIAAEPPKKTEESEAIALSPFTVTAGQDVGYLAGNSLSGSRMDTKLKDTAASISVMTEEFLKDIGATSLAEAVRWSNNTAVDLGETGTGDFGSGLGTNSGIEFEQGYRTRGLPATAARNYFKWTVPTDLYNIGRVEESRGPNSILFGVGSAGGLINISTKQPLLARAIRDIDLLVGSSDSRRAALDINQPLLNGKGAIRLNAVSGKINSFRNYAFSKNNRVDLAAKYRFNDKTQIRAEIERGVVDTNTPRSEALTIRSFNWLDGGRPTFSATSPATAFSAYGARLAATAPLRYISNSNQLLNMTGQIVNSIPAILPFSVVDKRIADPSINTGGPGALRTNRFGAYSVFLEHQLGRKTFLELAFNRQKYALSAFDAQATATTLQGDLNQTLPGTLGVNPYAGAMYLETTWRKFDRTEIANTWRASLSNEFDAGKWGVYRAAVLGEYEGRKYDSFTPLETWVGAPFNAGTPEIVANQVVRRSYVREGDWTSYYVNSPGTTGLIKNMVDPITGRTLSSTWISGASQNNSPAIQKSALLGLLAAYFGGRMVVGAGYRYDTTFLKKYNVVRNPVTNITEVDFQNSVPLSGSGKTMTLGVVGHVTKRVSLHYNRSDNSDTSRLDINVLPNFGPGPAPSAKGEDYGGAIDLLEGKFYIRATRYTTRSIGELAFGAGPFLTANRNITNGLLAASLISSADFAKYDIPRLNGTTRNKTSEGYELSLTANPTKVWRLQINGSISDAVGSKTAPELLAWWAVAKPYYESFPQTTAAGSGSTVGAQILSLETGILHDFRAVEGVGLIGTRKYKANFFTRYAFSSGWAKGASVGGGYRYQGRMLVGRRTVDQVLQYAPPIGEGSFLAGYNLRLKDRRQVRLQLNVDNIFDESDPIIARYYNTSVTTNVIQQAIIRAPRMWRLTADCSF